MNSRTLPSRPVGRTALAVGVGVAAAGAVAALLNGWLARRAEDRNLPIGRFITVNGIRLHYVDRGSGIPLVLLHGNGSMIEDFKSSGLLDRAARKYRVIAFDRPGFGHSDRPRDIVWTPQLQAQLIAAALTEIGVSKPMILGHSWGALVAVALALQYPRAVQALVRPWQLRAAAAETALMNPTVRGLRNRYRQLKMPVIIVAGAQDQFVESDQSRKLHREISDSTLRLIPSQGHMVHQTATSEVLSAIDTAAGYRRALGVEAAPANR